MDAPFIPRKTLDELATSHPEGTRHEAIIKIAMSLVGNRLPVDAVFATIRPQFSAEKTDKEIRDVIAWCQSRNPTPSVPRNGAVNGHSVIVATNGRHYGTNAPAKPQAAPAVEASPIELVEDFLDGHRETVESTLARSPLQIRGFETHATELFAALYQPEDKLNIVCKFTQDAKGKANPSGGGKTMLRDEWITRFKEQGAPTSEAGAWLRPNPCQDGSGKNGAIMDADISRHDFLLLESDVLSVEHQLAMFALLKLPIAAIITSGGKSIHAWLRLVAPSEADYTATATRIFAALKPFGFDQSNRNPSRLSRLPGGVRKIRAVGEGRQELLYLNPKTDPLTEELLSTFEKQVTPPFVSRYPMRKVARLAIGRYEELHANQGATGLRTGLATFDRRTGGLKRGTFIVLAAMTNVGKSALSLNVIAQALRDGKTVALFSYEMDRDEVYDLLLAMNFAVDRNCFNTGRFDEKDFQKIIVGNQQLAKWPLHIFDDPTLSCDQIETACATVLNLGALDLIVVDYLQLVPVFSRENREQQVAYIGRALRVIAKKFKCPLIAVSQLNEEGKIRESRAVTHDAHIVFILEQEKEDYWLRIVKGRSVQKDSYKMHFDAIYCKMGEESSVTSDRRHND